MDTNMEKKKTFKSDIQTLVKINKRGKEKRTEEGDSREVERRKKFSWAGAFKKFIKGLTVSYSKDKKWWSIEYWRKW